MGIKGAVKAVLFVCIFFGRVYSKGRNLTTRNKEGVVQTYFLFQQAVEDLFRERGWRYWFPLSIMGRLMEELGELAREVNHHHGDKKKRSGEAKGDIEEEIGDIYYTIFCFANANGYDVDRSLVRAARETGAYGNASPLSVLAELGSRIGKLIDIVNMEYGEEGADPDPSNPFIETSIGNVVRALEHLLQRLAYTPDRAIGKSLDKVIVRDKDRFPEGI